MDSVSEEKIEAGQPAVTEPSLTMETYDDARHAEQVAALWVAAGGLIALVAVIGV